MYVIIELQTDVEGHTSIIPTTKSTESLGYQEYYRVLGAAAVSNVYRHAAIFMNEQGLPIETKCFKHPAVEPEPEVIE